MDNMMGSPNPPERVYFLGPERPKGIPDVDPNGTFNGCRLETMKGSTKHILLPSSSWPSNQGRN